MIYIERPIDLFSLPQEYLLAHCISADYVLGAGIAREFRKRFKMNMWLRMTQTTFGWEGKGRCVIINLNRELKMDTPENGVYRVANLVTKENFWNKPTLNTVRESLVALREQLAANSAYKNVKRLGMPRIACGLDKRSWHDVSDLIKEVFKHTDLEICICTGEV